MLQNFNFKKVFSIVFAFLFLIQTLSSGVIAFNIKTDYIHRQGGMTTVQSAMSGFAGATSSFLTSLSDLIGDDMTLQGLVGFNALMANDSVTTGALRGISRSLIPPRRRRRETSRLTSERKALVAMSQVVNQGKMTATALRIIKDMFDDDLISPVGLTRLASLYRHHDIYYITMEEDRQDDERGGSEEYQAGGGDGGTMSRENSDNIQRKHAFTRFPGCEENDIIANGVVWAACNATYPGVGDNDTLYNMTYRNQWKDATDEHGWKYGNLYTMDQGFSSVSCPIGYRRMKGEDYKTSTNRGLLIQTLKLPLGGGFVCKMSDAACLDNHNYIKYHGKGLYGIYIISVGRDYYTRVQNGNFLSELPVDGEAGYLRCVRTTPPTEAELQEESYTRKSEKRCEEDRYTISRYDSNGEQSDTVKTCRRGCNDEPVCLNQEEVDEHEEEETPTQDEYINSKISEINQCYIDLYLSQVSELNTTIDSFQDSVRGAHHLNNDFKAQKYIKAIAILQKIKAKIARKYKSVFGIE